MAHNNLQTASFEDRGPSLRVACIVWMAVAILAIFFRFWSRALSEGDKHGRFWWDDWTILMALLWCPAANALEFAMTYTGLGRHVQTVSGQDVNMFVKLDFATGKVYNAGLGIAKCSALLFYMRVFGTNYRAFVIAVWVLQALNWIWVLGQSFGAFAQCSPVKKDWDSNIPGVCHGEDSLWLANAISNVIIDLAILILPMPMLSHLQIRGSRRMFLFMIFLCGYCVPIISLGRLISVIKQGTAINKDTTWALIVPSFLTVTEMPVLILGICLPSHFSLLHHIQKHGLAKLFTTRTDSSTVSTHHHSDESHTGRSQVPQNKLELGKISRTSSREPLYDGMHPTHGGRAEVTASPLERYEYASLINHPSEVYVSNEFRVTRILRDAKERATRHF